MTPHNEAKKNEIAPLVIMPGDPLRAKYFAKKFLKRAKLVNKVRGVFAYTGYYKNKRVTIMASGMGMPSIAIYATELFKFYGVEKIIRVGTCGALKEEIPLNQIILSKSSFTTSSFAKELSGRSKNLETASSILNKNILDNAKKYNINILTGKVNTSDIFYTEYDDKKIKKENPLAVEMETFALLYIAKRLKKEATAILTVSDNIITGKELSSKERQQTLIDSFLLALESL